MRPGRETNLRDYACRHLAAAIEDDLDDEQIMKEVWEACDSREEIKVVQDEMREIVTLIRARIATRSF